MLCPYCGKEAILTDDSNIYNGKSFNKKLYMCFPCKAWVGTHAGTDEPLGTLAKAELRVLRSYTHSVFDPLWRAGILGTRTQVYRWLKKRLKIPRKDCHIGMFDEETCRRAIKLCEEQLQLADEY